MKDSSSAPKRSNAQKEVDRIFIAGLLVKCVTIREITRRLNERNVSAGYTLSHVQVFQDSKIIFEEWRKEKIDLVDTKMELELAKLDKIENECWEAFERSKEGRRKTLITGGEMVGNQMSGGQIKEREIETTFGDTKFLDIIQKSMDKRAALLGLNAPTRISTEITSGIGSMTKDELERELETWKKKKS